MLSLALTGSPPVSLWLFMALCDSHSGPHWLSLPLSGILWLPLAHYCSLILCIQPLISSQGPFSALIADATMTHFLPLCLRDTCTSHFRPKHLTGLARECQDRSKYGQECAPRYETDAKLLTSEPSRGPKRGQGPLK